MEWRLDYSDSEIISETDSKTLVVSEIVWTPISDTDSVAKTAPGTISEGQPSLFRNWFRKRIPNQAFFELSKRYQKYAKKATSWRSHSRSASSALSLGDRPRPNVLGTLLSLEYRAIPRLAGNCHDAVAILLSWSGGRATNVFPDMSVSYAHRHQYIEQCLDLIR